MDVRVGMREEASLETLAYSSVHHTRSVSNQIDISDPLLLVMASF